MHQIEHRSPRVGVIIPTYNGGKYLALTVESVFKQTFSNFEIIVVDDGSNENLCSVLKPFTKKLFYVYKKRSGPAASRNLGIRLCRCEYIALLDHDDIWLPNNLERKVKILTNNAEAGMVYSYPDIVDSAGKIIPYQSPSTFPQGRVFRDFLRKNRITTFSATLIRRAVFDRVGLLDERPEATTCDDYDLWLRISELYDIKFDESREVLYRVHDTNLVKKLELNLSAHLFVFNKTLRASPGVRSISEKERRQIIDGHLRDKYLWFAEKYLYDNKDSAKARRLYVKALMIKPWDINALWHLLICVVPRRIKAWLKKSVLKNVFLKRSIFTKG